MSTFPFNSTDLDIMVRTLSGECRSEPLNGQIAIAWVIRTRAEWPGPVWWGNSIKEVCLKPWQFSCWLDKDWNKGNLAHMQRLKPADTEYRVLELVCLDVLHGNVPDPTHGATHYKVRGTKASWDAAVAHLTPVDIGAHQFYNLGPTG